MYSYLIGLSVFVGFIALAVRSEEEEGSGLHLVLLLNPTLRDLLYQHGIRDIVSQGSFVCSG
jgi:hypothetical protein